ncbi:hypothetical protein CFP56_042143 [Quercus suber]|uniref:Uncharacterized protein n=1 Tax=Quercus suber TaxID=58331 RepID=A0AAW0MBI3_QUESU
MNCLGRDADEAKAEEFNDMACKASLADQQKQLQENIHAQIKSFSMIVEAQELPPQPIAAPCQSGLGFDIGRNGQPTDHPGKILFVKKEPFPMLHYELEVVLEHPATTIWEGMLKRHMQRRS